MARFLCRIGPLYLADAPACAAIESQVFAKESPWSEQSFRDEISHQAARYLALRLANAEDLKSAGVKLPAGLQPGDLVGFAGIAQRGREDDFFEYEILTIAVDPRIQGAGWGRILLSALLEGTEDGTVFLEVRQGNDPAMQLYQSCGFEVVGIRRGYYQPAGADAVVMRRLPVDTATVEEDYEH